MEAKELMINDLVYEGSDKVIKICRNYGRSISYIDELDTKYYPGKTMHEVEEACLNPIPLTEEMLEINGFEASPMKDLFLYTKLWQECLLEVYPSEGSHVFIYQDKNPIDFVRDKVQIHIKYVHELQHALRLIRLDELADNFKVK